MSPTVPKKDFLDFLSDYYFNTKSPVAFTSPLALYREAKKRYPSLTFRQVKVPLRVRQFFCFWKLFVALNNCANFFGAPTNLNGCIGLQSS